MSDPNLPSPSSHQTIPFPFPPKHISYPPLFSLQPTLLTRHAQLKTWSRYIQSYCRHYRLHKLVLSTALGSPLFHNQQLKKRMSGQHLRELVKFMVSEGRAEWIGGEKDGRAFWVWWKRPEEWAEVLAGWVDETGQKNTVLTLYELVNGETTLSQGRYCTPALDLLEGNNLLIGDLQTLQEFHGMDMELLQRSLQVLVKRGKAQIFGSEDQQGVKFF